MELKSGHFNIFVQYTCVTHPLKKNNFYYICSGFNGTIHVVPPSDILVPLTLVVNSDPIQTPSNITCGATTPQIFNHYTYSVDHTPRIVATFPQVFSYLNKNLVTVTGLAEDREHNLFTIGGKACIESGAFSGNLVRPDYSGTSDSTIEYFGSEEIAVDCELDLVEPGIYKPVLHVAGRGWGLVADGAILEVLPAYSSTHPDDPTGSLRGGTLLEISARGLSTDDITKTRVEIGNTPCTVQKISPEDERIYCLTQPARGDGYSSLVEALGPLAYWTLQTDYYDIGI